MLSITPPLVYVAMTCKTHALHIHSDDLHQGRSQDFVMGGAKRKFGWANLKNFKILNIGLRNFYVMFK